MMKFLIVTLLDRLRFVFPVEMCGRSAENICSLQSTQISEIANAFQESSFGQEQYSPPKFADESIQTLQY